MEHKDTIWFDVEHKMFFTRKEMLTILECEDINVVGPLEACEIDGILYEIVPFYIIPLMS